MTTLVVVGQGYVGLPMAVRATEVGIKVIGLDANAEVAKQLSEGHSHIVDVTDEKLAEAIKNGYEATADPACIERADVVIVCVPTPLGPDGGPDLRPVESAGRDIGAHVKKGTLVILESTTYPGTTEELFAPLVLTDKYSDPEDILLAFSPERINPRDPIYGVQNTPKVVGGTSPEATEKAAEFYRRFIDTVVTTKGAKEAEMAKLLENTYRHVNIALVNEMVRFSHELDIDLWDAIKAADSKPFGFQAFWPGPGVGGHCIPVDPMYLSHRVKAKLGYAFRMVELAEEINLAAPHYVTTRARALLDEAGIPVKGAKVLLLGIAYKPDVPDMRETPAEPVADDFIKWGCDLRYNDPHVPTWERRHTDGWVPMNSQDDVLAAAADADIVVLLQSHKAYDLPAIAAASKIFLDTRGALPESETVHRL